MLRNSKSVLLAFTRQVGAGRLFARTAWRRRRLLLLCYHGVSLKDEHLWDPRLFTSPEVFERRLQTLDRIDCTVLPLGEAIERLYRNDLPARAVSLTFDDGYHDFMAMAQPRLREYGFPATVYLNTLRCEQNFPVTRIALSYVLWKSGRPALDGRGLPGLEPIDYEIASFDRCRSVAIAVHDHLLAVDASVREQDDVLAEVAGRVGIDYAAFKASRMLTLMRPQDVTAMAREGVDFQLHTHRHRSPPEADLFADEIRENRWRIEAMTGVRPTHFCYPSGIYRESHFALLEAEGVISATTTEPGLAARSDARFLLPRFVDMQAVPDAEFEAWLTGIAPWAKNVVGRSRTNSEAGS
ncbi:MAG: polysaccharide deacetylase family protein [Vicinamibacterales bacterium]